MGNIVMAQGGIPIQQGIYEESITKKCELGRLLPFLDGRCFRYCQADSAITKGHTCSSAAVVANDNTITQTGMAAQAIGKKVINVLLGGATTQNLYEDGLLIIEGGTGLGQAYRIKSNKAGGAAVATPCELTLYDPLLVALNDTSVISLTKNRYKDVVITPAALTGVPIGVPLITITDNYYFWAQTKGYAPVVVDDDAALTVGDAVTVGGGDPGAALLVVAAAITKHIGTVVADCAVDTYATIDLDLE